MHATKLISYNNHFKSHSININHTPKRSHTKGNYLQTHQCNAKCPIFQSQACENQFKKHRYFKLTQNTLIKFNRHSSENKRMLQKKKKHQTVDEKHAREETSIDKVENHGVMNKAVSFDCLSDCRIF